MASRNAGRNARRFIPDIEIADAHISGRPNFSGAERTHNGRVVNSEGNRNFCVDIPEEGVLLADGSGTYVSAEELIDIGWKVRIHAGSEDDNPSYFLPINVNFGFRPPTIWSVTGKKRVPVNENTVDLLDGRNFSRVDLVIHPSVRQDWDTGDISVTAYLDEGFFYIKTSSFEDAWQEDHPEDDFE